MNHRLFKVIVAVTFISILFAVAGGDNNDPQNVNQLTISNVTQQWVVTKQTGAESVWKVIFANAKDKKTDICFVLKDGVNVSSVDTTDKTIYGSAGTAILDDKNKPITIKYETAKCNDNGVMKDGYHLALTTAASVNIDNYIRIGTQTLVMEYQDVKMISYDTGWAKLNITLYINVGGSWNNTANGIYVYNSAEKDKFGANISNFTTDLQSRYIIDSTETIVPEDTNTYRFGRKIYNGAMVTSENYYLRFAQICEAQTISENVTFQPNCTFQINGKQLVSTFYARFDPILNMIQIDPEVAQGNVTQFAATNVNATAEDWPYIHASTSDPSLILYLTFDMNASANGNTTYDYSDYNNNAAVTNLAAMNWSSDGGYIGGTMDFDQVTRYQVKGPFENTVAFNISHQPNITISFWEKMPNVNWPTGLMSAISSVGAGADVVDIYCTGAGTDSMTAVMHNDTQSNIGSITNSSVDCSNGQWQHYVLTFSDGLMSLYYNGIKTANNTVFASTQRITALSATAKQITIGAAPTGSQAFNGTVDEVMIYNRSLDANEVLQLYYHQLPTFKDGAYSIMSQVNITQDGSLNRVNVTANVTALNGSVLGMFLEEFNSTGVNYQNTSIINFSNGFNQINTYTISTTTFNVSAVPIYYLNLNKSTTPHISDGISFNSYGVGGADTVAPTFSQNPTNITRASKVLLSIKYNATDNVNIDQFFLNDTTNFNITSAGLLANKTTIAIGVLWLNITVNDTSNNVVSAIIYFNTTDDIAPVATQQLTNLTTTVGGAWVVKWNVTDNVAVDRYFINWSQYFTINATGYIMNMTQPGAGNYTINVSVNDTSNNILSQLWGVQYLSSGDTQPPQLSQPLGNISVTYKSLVSLKSNWTDDVAIQSYSINDTNFIINATGHIFNSSNPGVKYYPLNVTVTDTTGNANSTIFSVNITRASSSTSLTFNVNSPQAYGISIIPTCSAINGEIVNLTRNGTTIASGSSMVLAVGSYLFNCSHDNTQNYTKSENTSVFVVSKAPTTNTLSTVPSSPITYGLASMFNCSNTGGLLTNLTLNGSLINTQNGTSVVRGVGSYNVTCKDTGGNENYTTAAQVQTIYNIAKNASLTRTYINSVRANTSVTNGTSVTFNCTRMLGESECYLYYNGTFLGYSNSSVATSIVINASGSYNVTSNISASENYTSSSETYVLTVTGPRTVSTIYADQSLAADCSNNSYNITSRLCDGTDGNAFNTLQEVVNNMTAGDTVLIRNGTYKNNIVQNSSGILVNIRNMIGTASTKIIFKNYNDEVVAIDGTPGKYRTIQITNSSYIEFSGLIINDSRTSLVGISIAAHSSNLKFENITISNYSDKGMIMASSTGDIHDIEIRNSHFQYNGNGGFWVAADSSDCTTNILIEDSTSTWNGWANYEYGQGFSTKGNCNSNITLRNDISYNQVSAGFGLMDIYNSTVDNCIAFNTTLLATPGHTADSRGFGLMIGNNNTIKNSVSFNHYNDGFNPNTPASGTYNNYVYHDLAFDNTECPSVCPTGWNCTQCLGRGITLADGDFINNLVYNNKNGFVGSTYNRNVTNNFCSDSTCLTSVFTNSVSQADPQFVNISGARLEAMNFIVDYANNINNITYKNLFRQKMRSYLSPATGSPLIDAGAYVSGLHCPQSNSSKHITTTFFSGCLEWWGSAPDMGAYEYVPNLTTISIIYPTNMTVYASAISLVNLSVINRSGLDKCWYSINTTSNVTFNCATNITTLATKEGQNILTVYANDTSNNVDSDQIIFFVSTGGSPFYYDEDVTPDSELDLRTRNNMVFSIYALDGDGISQVLLEFNNTNYTASNTASAYNVTFVNPLAGRYTYRWYINDTSNNANSTTQKNYIVFPPRYVWADGNLASDCTGFTYNKVTRACNGADGAGFKTISTAAGNLSGGDVLEIRAGTYLNNEIDELAVYGQLKANGTSGYPIVFEAYKNETVIIDGKRTMRTAFGNAQTGTNPFHYLTYRGLIIMNYTDSAFYFTNSSNIVIENCNVTNIYGTAAIWFLSGNHDITIRRNYVTDIYGAGIKLYQNLGTPLRDYNVTIDRNYVARSNSSDCITIWHTMYVNVTNNVMEECVYATSSGGGNRYARFEDNTIISPGYYNGVNMYLARDTHASGDGLKYGLGSGNYGNNSYSRNKVLGGAMEGIYILNENNDQVYNNVVFNATRNLNSSSNYAGYRFNTAMLTSKVKNNIGCYNQYDANLFIGTNTIDHNFWCDGTVNGTNVYSGNPQFVTTNLSAIASGVDRTISSATFGDVPGLHLVAGSPAIDSGTYIAGYHCVCADDNTSCTTSKTPSCQVWYGNAPDLGAYEYNSSAQITLRVAYPTATTYYVNISDFNYSFFNATSYDKCWYSINASVNATITCGANVTTMNVTQGSNNWTIYANDTSNILYTASVTFNVDSVTPPQYSSLSISPSAATYSVGGTYQFNITATDLGGVDKVILDMNGTNYTASVISGNVYNVTLVNLVGGSYTYRWHLNDTVNNNRNVTSPATYTVSKAIGDLRLYLNNNRNSVRIDNASSVVINATLISGAGTIAVYYNGTLLNNGTSPLVNTKYDNVGIYTILTNYSGNQNYTSDEESWQLEFTTAVTDTTPPVVTIYSPVDGATYTSTNITVNLSASDDFAIDTVWFEYDNTNTTYDTETSINATSTNNVFKVYANDTSNNSVSYSITFTYNEEITTGGGGGGGGGGVNEQELNFSDKDGAEISTRLNIFPYIVVFVVVYMIYVNRKRRRLK